MLPSWVLLGNVRLDWKVIARYKHSSLFGLVVSNEEKSFIMLTPERRKRRKRDKKGGKGKGYVVF
jgi:hypothetical protein